MLIQVGPAQALKTPSAAAQVAPDGATVLVDAGVYRADTAIWNQDRLTLRATGGRVRLIADGAAAEGKAIWVMRGGGVVVQGFDFEGCAVPDRNGAGIRLERGSLKVIDCSFMRNEMGLLTNNDARIVLEVEGSEFAYNWRPDGHNHNLYAGTIARLTVRGSYFHHAYIGHLLKSRAAINDIAYNRLTDEADGSASYELEFPNGGVARVIGNIVQQSPSTENRHMISFGAEGYTWPVNEFYLSHNTLVDDLPHGGVLARVRPGAAIVRVIDNLLVRPASGHAPARWDLPENADLRANLQVDADAIDRSPAGGFALKRAVAAADRAVDAGLGGGQSLDPGDEYRHPRSVAALSSPPRQPGAIQRLAP